MSTEDQPTVPPTLRELQLELQVWIERSRALEAKGHLLQAQSVILQSEAAGCKAQIDRLHAILAPKPVAVPDAPAEAAA